MPEANNKDRNRYELQFYKTQQCSFYEAGKCTRGDKCKYAHGTSELRTRPDLTFTSLCRKLTTTGACDDPSCSFAHNPEQLRATKKFFKTSLCKFYLNGRCRQGEDCRHAHGEDELQPLTAQKPAQQVGLSAPPGLSRDAGDFDLSRTYAASVLLNAAAAGLGILECRLTPGRREPSNTAYDAYVRRIQGEASETPRLMLRSKDVQQSLTIEPMAVAVGGWDVTAIGLLRLWYQADRHRLGWQEFGHLWHVERLPRRQTFCPLGPLSLQARMWTGIHQIALVEDRLDSSSVSTFVRSNMSDAAAGRTEMIDFPESFRPFGCQLSISQSGRKVELSHALYQFSVANNALRQRSSTPTPMPLLVDPVKTLLVRQPPDRMWIMWLERMLLSHYEPKILLPSTAGVYLPSQAKPAANGGYGETDQVVQVTGMLHAFALKEIDDRDDELIYRHEVWRMEHELQEAMPKVYTRLMEYCRALDNELWGEIEVGDRFYPEIEYIQYDVGKLGEAGTIEPHTDNESQVTVVVLLSQLTEFQGGLNCFEPGWKGGESRSARLGTGDAAFFYGDKCEHWITPVTSGHRTILQMDARQHARPYKTNPKVVRNGGFLTWGVGRNHPPGRPLQVTQDAVAPSYPLYAISWLSWFPHSPVRPGRSKCVCFFWQFGSGRSWNRRVRVRRSHSRSVDIGLEMSNRWVRRGGGGWVQCQWGQ
ncbi:ZFP36L1 [Symbiodinium natans]|uniref:ZFP36L1 protein n=1 Tax=Symbiodinium natans TaxID=878477 RepID=A0A812TVK6_9DINO|nr:ZFP36L1 [Symbiodinium natans]